MIINSKANRKIEQVKVKTKVLLETLEETNKCYLMNCRYNQDLDQFIVYCFVDRNDDDAFYTIKFDYDEVI